MRWPSVFCVWLAHYLHKTCLSTRSSCACCGCCSSSWSWFYTGTYLPSNQRRKACGWRWNRRRTRKRRRRWLGVMSSWHTPTELSTRTSWRTPPPLRLRLLLSTEPRTPSKTSAPAEVSEGWLAVPGNDTQLSFGSFVGSVYREVSPPIHMFWISCIDSPAVAHSCTSAQISWALIRPACVCRVACVPTCILCRVSDAGFAS